MSHAGLALMIFALSVVMIMSGRGGGNFYVLALVLVGTPIHEAATTSQLILLASALCGAAVFGKARNLSWPLTAFFGGLSSAAAFLGGSAAHLFSGVVIKLILSALLAVAGVLMLLPERELERRETSRFGCWNVRQGKETYVVHLPLAAPLTLASGFLSGMVGISGGSFLVPLMVLGCGAPMRVAVGTATAMAAATALTGFTGSALHGGLNGALALHCGVAGAVGGLLGGKIALKTDPKRLKTISGVLTILAAAAVFVNALAHP